MLAAFNHDYNSQPAKTRPATQSQKLSASFIFIRRLLIQQLICINVRLFKQNAQ